MCWWENLHITLDITLEVLCARVCVFVCVLDACVCVCRGCLAVQLSGWLQRQPSQTPCSCQAQLAGEWKCACIRAGWHTCSRAQVCTCKQEFQINCFWNLRNQQHFGSSLWRTSSQFTCVSNNSPRFFYPATLYHDTNPPPPLSPFSQKAGTHTCAHTRTHTHTAAS